MSAGLVAEPHPSTMHTQCSSSTSSSSLTTTTITSKHAQGHAREQGQGLAQHRHHDPDTTTTTKPLPHLHLDTFTSTPHLPSPPVPASGHQELSQVSGQLLSAFSASPAKMTQLQGLISSLHTVMDDQSFAMVGLRTQLDDIQDALTRVQPKQAGMTAEERHLLQNAQIMKDLAEEVMATKLERPVSRTSSNHDLARSISSAGIASEPQTPPPTARTPPPGPLFGSGSNNSLIDRQYTPETEGRSSRPSSAASSLRRQQKQKHRQSLRQLETEAGRGGGGGRYEQESNAAFERICSLLTHLITDASTAVGTSIDGTKPTIPLPTISPLLPSDSDASLDSASEEDGTDKDLDDFEGSDGDEQADLWQDQHGYDHGHPLEYVQEPEIDPEYDLHHSPDLDPAYDHRHDQDLEYEEPVQSLGQSLGHSLQDAMGTPDIDEYDHEVQVIPRRRSGTGVSLRNRALTKRLSSLFVELQNTPMSQDLFQEPKSPLGQRLEDELGTKQRRVRNSMSMASMASSSSSTKIRLNKPNRRASAILSTQPTMDSAHSKETAESSDSSECRSESQRFSRTPRPRASSTVFSGSCSIRNSVALEEQANQARQQADSELDKTVETIDGLTRDLVAVAAHQNWMQMKLQRSLQFQQQQVENIEKAHSTLGSSTSATSTTTVAAATTSEAGQDRLSLATLGAQERSLPHQNPLMDLSKSLKQVAVSVGKVLASTASAGSHPSPEQPTMPRRRLGSPQTGTKFPGKDFSKYFQELEKIAALGGKLGSSGKEDLDEDLEQVLALGGKTRERIVPEEAFGNPKDNFRFSGSSFTLTSGSSRNSAASTLSADSHVEALGGEGEDDLRDEMHREKTLQRSSGTNSPPELEDFAAQCRLLTRALVLPFVQLTHHAMTSQDSVLALNPATVASEQVISELDPAEEQTHSRSTTASDTFAAPSQKSSSILSGSGIASPSRAESSPEQSLLPVWSLSGKELDSFLKEHGELSPDSLVKAKTFVSTGLFLIHLLYWTVLFILGSLILDPWLAETAGQQVIRIVDQVRSAIATEERGRLVALENRTLTFAQRSLETERASLEGAASSLSELSPVATPKATPPRASFRDLFYSKLEEEDTHERPGKEAAQAQARAQALEDRAIEVAVGFESLKHRLGANNIHGSPSVSRTTTTKASSRSNSRPVSGLWSGNSFQSTASVLTEAVRNMSLDQDISRTAESTTTGSVKSGLMRTVSWVGPRRRRVLHPSQGKDTARARRFSGTRTMTLPVLVPRGASNNSGKERPLSLWGSFGSSQAVEGDLSASLLLHAAEETAKGLNSPPLSVASSSTTLSEWTVASSSGPESFLVDKALQSRGEFRLSSTGASSAASTASRSRRNSM